MRWLKGCGRRGRPRRGRHRSTVVVLVSRLRRRTSSILAWWHATVHLQLLRRRSARCLLVRRRDRTSLRRGVWSLLLLLRKLGRRRGKVGRRTGRRKRLLLRRGDTLALRRPRRSVGRESTVGLSERVRRSRPREFGAVIHRGVDPCAGRTWRRHGTFGAAAADGRRRAETRSTRSAGRKAGFLSGGDNLVVENCQRRTQDDPLDAVLVAVADTLPDCLFLVGATRDSDASSSSCLGRVLADPTKFDSLRRDEMTSVGKVEHGPVRGIRVRFRDLEQRLVGLRLVGIRQEQLVHRVLMIEHVRQLTYSFFGA
jgi:hypothetical protein